MESLKKVRKRKIFYFTKKECLPSINYLVLNIFLRVLINTVHIFTATFCSFLLRFLIWMKTFIVFVTSTSDILSLSFSVNMFVSSKNFLQNNSFLFIIHVNFQKVRAKLLRYPCYSLKLFLKSLLLYV